jgi:hypothetical protein
MRLVGLAIVASCAKPAAPEPPAGQRTVWKSVVTPLEVIVLDDYRTRESCDGVAPRQLEVALDDKPIVTIAVPCSIAVHSPPLQLAAPAFQVGPGTHVIRVRERASGREAEAVVEFPRFEPPFGELDDDVERVLATKLPVWANEDELEIQGLRTQMKL